MTKRSNKYEFLLLRLRYREGRLVEMAGNTPILLDNPDMAWIVYSGKINVFAVRLQEGKPIGARIPLFRAESGDGLLGIAPNGQEFGLLASSGPGTQLLRLKRSSLEQLSGNIEFVEALAILIDGWINCLSAALNRALIPRDAQILEPGKDVLLPVDGIAHTRKETLWVKHIAGCSYFSGRRDLPPVEGDQAIPLTAQTWLQAIEPSTISATNTMTALEQEFLWPGLDHFHRLALSGLATNIRNGEQADMERLDDKASTDAARVGEAFSDLASVLGAVDMADLGRHGQDPLLLACQLVAQAQRIVLRIPPRAVQRDSLQSVAQAARIRLRRVALRDEWWTGDHGPLLGYLDNRPVALLPDSPQRYRLHDPLTGSVTPVDGAVASTLSNFAYSFYRPLPERAMSGLHLLRFGVQGSRRDLWTAALTGIGVGAMSTAVPLTIGVLFDTVIPGGERSQLIQLAAILLACALAAVLFRVAQGAAILRVTSKMEASIQAAIFDRLINLPAAFFRGYSAGDLGLRALGVGAARQALSGVVVSAVVSAFLALFSLGLLFFFDAQLTMMAAGLAGIAALVLMVAGLLQLRYQQALLTIQGTLSGRVLGFINGVAKFRVAGAEQRAFTHWARTFAVERRLAFRARTFSNALATFNNAFPLVALMVLFGLIADQSRLTTGSFVAFAFAFAQFLTAVLSLGIAFMAALSTIPIYERARPILDTLPEADVARADPGEVNGEIEVSSVSFRYKKDGPLILDDVSIHVQPGEFVAIVGPSGSGKSTLLRLLLGFETPTSGAILYSGQDLAELNNRAVRRQIGVVLQDGKLMAGGIFSNIAGSATLTIDNAWEAARMAGLDEDIRRMPMGMQTILNEGGSTLSGGQRQRLLIARAVASKPRLVFFDEATSALDNETQTLINRSLESLEATRVIIAHRLSTIRNADRIIVIHNGRVVQMGTYDDLISRRGLFAELAKRQLA